MESESYSLPHSHIDSEGYEIPSSWKTSLKATNLEKAHSTTVRLFAAITSHTYVPALAAILGAFTTRNVDSYLQSFAGVLATIIALTFFILALAALSVSVLRFSKWIQGIIQQYWNLSTYPFTHESEEMLKSPLKSQFNFVISLILSEKKAELRGRPFRTFRVAATQTMLGAFLVSLGIFCTVLAIELGIVEDSTISTEISLLSAFVSVLLGRTLGVVALSTISIASSWIDLAFIGGVILFPATLLVPASGNFINGMESILKQNFTDSYGSSGPLQDTVILAVITIFSAGIFCYVSLIFVEAF